MAFYVYILKCADGSYYTGHTDNADVRMAAHQDSKAKSWVSKRLPVELMYIDTSPTREEALAFEFQTKKWSRAKKEALIARDWERLKLLAKSYASTSVHGSTSSPRTGEKSDSAEDGENASIAESVSSVRGELVEPRPLNNE
ncbi:MAG: GIY-YIG nuclease family protein [Casimicrobium sp.]